MGYAFKAITHLDGLRNLPGLLYVSREEQIEPESSVLLTNESDAVLGNDVYASEGDFPETVSVTIKRFGMVGQTQHRGLQYLRRSTRQEALVH